MNNGRKKFIIVLIKNGTIIPQTGLEYDSRHAAESTAENLNEILPPNMLGAEHYAVVLTEEIEDLLANE